MVQSEKPAASQEPVAESELTAQPQEASAQKPSPSQLSTPSKDVNVNDEWLRLIYSEAWKQYSHEDTLGQTRMSIFVGVHSALIGILAIITKPLLDIPAISIGAHRFW